MTPSVPLRHVIPAWAILLVALLHPASGLGIELCPFPRWLGVPCPGCGITRSISCTARGDLIASIGHHPFGPVLFLLAAAVAILALLPAPAARPIIAGIAGRQHMVRIIATAAGALLLVFGAVRIALQTSGA